MNNLERFHSGIKSDKTNKVLNAIEINAKVFKNLYPIKGTSGLDYLTFHITDKSKILSQFKDNVDLIDYLNYNLPEGNILYIDYIEVNGKYRDKGLGSKIVTELIDKSREIGLSGIYLDSYSDSTDFWDKNGFHVDSDEQEEKDGEYSDLHSAFLDLNSVIN